MDLDELQIQKHQRHMAIYQVLLIFVLPIVLLYFNIIKKDWRVLILLCVTLVIYAIIRKEYWPREKLGLHLHNFTKSIFVYSLFTTIGIVLLFKIADYLGYTFVSEFWKQPHFLFLFLPVSFFQEFAYRGFLIPLLEKIHNNNFFIIFTSGVLFSFLHIIYPHPEIMIPIALYAGFAYAAIYRYRPNLVLTSISHAILNYVAVALGFFYLASSAISL